MLAVKVKRSLKRIISSKKKVLEIQHVIATKRIKDTKAISNKNHPNIMEGPTIIQNCESSIHKLEFIESCISDNEYTVINLLRDDRYEQLSMKEIYDELFMDFKREMKVKHQYLHMAQTG